MKIQNEFELALDIAERNRDPQNDDEWSDIAELWRPRSDTIYLNHGSFGLSPRPVREFRRRMIDRLDEQPMDFYVRQWEPLLDEARGKTAEFFGTEKSNLVFVENATFGMNVVASSFPLQAGDEVLLNDHEYGAVHRIWERATKSVGAKSVVVDFPEKLESADQVIDALMSKVSPRTKLLVISHITSPTAIILPIKQICQAFKDRGIAICVDGPHAPIHVELNIDDLGCDFYTASCHKWLCATLGSGFCFAHSNWHEHMQPPLLSWGRLLPALPQTWDDEFIWPGTRDPSPCLSIPVAIETMRQIGVESVRERCHHQAAYARQRLVELTGQPPLAPDHWYGCMAHVPLPTEAKCDYSQLQKHLWDSRGIEVPVADFNQRWYVRVSTHVYNRRDQVDMLVEAIGDFIS